jgi:hypothetical protein
MRIPGNVITFSSLVLLTPIAAGAQSIIDLPAQDRPLTDAPAGVWAVGTDEGESWEMFAGITQLAFDSSDNLYVLDQGNSRVLVFDADGVFLREFGKQGGGPGEFQFPSSLNITRNGSIAVYDMMRRGFSMFDAEGEYLDHVPVAEGYGSLRPNEIHTHPLGGVIARSMPALNTGNPVTADSLPSPVFHQLFGDESTARTVYEFMMPAPAVQTRDAGGGRQIRMVAFSRPTFAAEPSWGVLPDGRLAISREQDWVIGITDAGGRPQTTLRRPFKGREVTRRDQEDAREQRRVELREGGGPGGVRVSTSSSGGTAVWRTGPGGVSSGGEMTDEQIERAVEGMEFADVIPAIRQIAVDPSGRIWVVRNPERVGRDEPIDLLTADGHYIGTLTGYDVPRAVSASGLAVWVEKNDLDIEQIVVRRLPASWR